MLSPTMTAACGGFRGVQTVEQLPGPMGGRGPRGKIPQQLPAGLVGVHHTHVRVHHEDGGGQGVEHDAQETVFGFGIAHGPDPALGGAGTPHPG